MNTIKIITTLAFTTALAGAQGKSREMRLEECPPPVQSTVQANARGGNIEEVDLINIDGKVIYIAEAELPRDRDLKIYVSGNGALMKTLEEVLLRETPEAVRNAVQGLGGRVDEVNLETEGQTLSYHVEIDRQGAPDLDVVVSATGAILSQTEEAND